MTAPDDPSPVDPADLDTDRRLRLLDEQVRLLRRALLRTWAVVVAALLVAGLLVPVFAEDLDGRTVTLRTATAWWTALVDPGPDDEGALVLLGVGFLGLALVALAALWVLVAEVVAGAGRSARDGVRSWVATLLILGSVVPALLSLFAWSSAQDAGDERAGWGGVLLLAGAAGFAVLVTRRDSRDLWVDAPAGPRR